jgi:ribosome-associated translation inhibitor RaiA
MLRNLEFKNFSPSPRLRELAEGLIGRLERLAPTFATDTISLRMFMDQNPSRRLYHVTLQCSPPGRRLAAKEERHDPGDAIRAAFAELERQFGRHMEMIHHSNFSKRMARRGPTRRDRIEAAPQPERAQDQAVPQGQEVSADVGVVRSSAERR